MHLVLLAIVGLVANSRFPNNRKGAQVRLQQLPCVRRVPETLEEHCFEATYWVFS